MHEKTKTVVVQCKVNAYLNAFKVSTVIHKPCCLSYHEYLLSKSNIKPWTSTNITS